jgi:alkylation response protein AidB-like acyl-CoA dehydrogenase
VDLRPTPEDLAYRQKVRAWLEANVPRHALQTREERLAWHRKLYDAGFIGMGWPKQYGGHEARPMEQAIVSEELARANAPSPLNGLGIGFIGPTLIVHGSEEQKQRYLKKILTAEAIWCQLYSEPNAGSDLASLRTSAVRQDGRWLVNGQKVWTSSGMSADLGILLARTDPSVRKHEGISYFIVDMHSPGVEVRPLRQITGGAEFAEVFMTNLQVPAENLIGELNKGWQMAQTTLGFERGANILSRVTTYKQGFERLVQACRTLKRNGRPAIEDPAVRQKLGRIYAEIEVMRYAGLRLLTKLERGERPGPESSIDKLYYTEAHKRHTELIQEILGPYGGLETGSPAELRQGEAEEAGQSGSWVYDFLYAKAATIYAGSSEIQKNIIGERVLGLPREVRADRQAILAAAGRSGQQARPNGS